MTSSTLGSAIRARRRALGLTQAELAARLGGEVPQFEISRLERDRFQLHGLRRLAQVAEALGLTLGELLEQAGWGEAARAVRVTELAQTSTPPEIVIVPAPPAQGAAGDRATRAVEATVARCRAARASAAASVERATDLRAISHELLARVMGGDGAPLQRSG